MSRGLHEGSTRYGDAGFSLFLREAFITSAVYADDTRDLEGRRIDLRVDEVERVARVAALPAPERPEWTSCDQTCFPRNTVTQADEGCDFDVLRRGG